MPSILKKFLAQKPVLALNFDYERAGVKYKDVLARGLTCVFSEWEDVQFIDGRCVALGKQISEYSFIVIGPVGENDAYYTSVKEAADSAGVPYFSYGRSEEECSKVLQTLRFKRDSVPHPKTVISFADPDKADALTKELKLPLVTKIVDGSQGKGIEKHETVDELKRCLAKLKGQVVIAQEALTTSCDYRIFFIYDEPMFVMKRSATKKGEFRHNVSLGGKYEVVTEPEQEMMQLAKLAQRSMGFDVSGVDLIQDDETKRWYVLEVNSAPQFITPKRVLERLVELIKQRIG